MLNRQTGLAWKYHDLTRHSYFSVRSSPHYLDWENRPSPFKVYPDAPSIALPRELAPSGYPLLEAIAFDGQGGEAERTPTLEELASLLFYSAGVLRTKTYPAGVIYFRAAACAGALYPVEVYVACKDIEGLAAGVYHFSPGDFSLKCLRKGDHRSIIVDAAGGEPRVARAPVILIYSAISWRSSWKYRDRAYRYHYWDNGTIVANALAMARGLEVPASLVMGFVERDINRLVGIDGERELALSLLAFGLDSQGAPPAPVPVDLNQSTIPLSAREADYPSIREMHAASSLADEEEVAAWHEGKYEKVVPPASGRQVPLSAPGNDSLPGDSIEEVIARRASTRRFARKALPFQDMSIILDRSTRGFSSDFGHSPCAQLNDLYAIVNRVDGLEPGAYFFRRGDGALELLKGGSFSDKAAYLTLDQALGGDSAFTLFFMADLKGILESFGNRGYRAAQMESSVVGGKAYLAAYALRRGATGLTFYDDDVTEFFSPHAAGKSCIFAVAVGVPGKRPIY
ncbi:MAG TPA: SagB family peptide dehydrogenase [Blastocatellia bacterium]|nr:SagB family peptide dehydrogenase [Blastocatellia bacterium]